MTEQTDLVNTFDEIKCPECEEEFYLLKNEKRQKEQVCPICQNDLEKLKVKNDLA